jgi:predicted alpha-1,2-mannosidase
MEIEELFQALNLPVRDNDFEFLLAWTVSLPVRAQVLISFLRHHNPIEEWIYMVTRRTFLGGISALCAGTLSSAYALEQHAFAPAAASTDLTQFVDPMIGTGGHGHTYPGATVPFGAVQLSPDTFNSEWDWCSGYHISDSSIMGFSHTHLSGTGCGDLLDILLMPGTGEVKLVPGSRENPDEGYRSRFSHQDEVARPGYYSVLLKDYNIKAELTATERTGFHRYTFPQSESSHFMLDLEHAYMSPNTVEWGRMRKAGPDLIVGGRSTKAWGNGREVYFAMQFSKVPDRITWYAEDHEVDSSDAVNGKVVKCVLHYTTTPGEVIQVKTGISGTSEENALKNLKAESPGWDFEKLAREAQAKWQHELSKIRITMADDVHKKIFYTGLYHMMLGPTLFDDVDGTYKGMDKQVHTVPVGQRNYTTYSLWDTFRAEHPMFTLFQTERVPDFVNSLIRMADQSPQGMPVWPLQGTETGTMVGYHSASVIAEACVKRFSGIDFETGYKLMRKRALSDGWRGLSYYRDMQYIPCDKQGESVSKTCEYSYNAWGVAQVAKKLGNDADTNLLLQEAAYYRNLFDKETTFIRPKLADGSWALPFTPIEMGHEKKWRDYTEANPWQTTFLVQHDSAGLINLFGGAEQYAAKLDALFSAPSDLPPDAPPDIAGMVGQYAHGNEPNHHIAYLYVYAGQPWKTQARVRSLMETMYQAQPDGLIGNEDCGQMSAWYVMSALGFYSVDPVSGNYVLGTPLVDAATIALANNKKLVIKVERGTASDMYIQSITLNGKLHTRSWFSHEDIVNGAELIFKLGSEPNLKFGSHPKDLPPSLSSLLS